MVEKIPPLRISIAKIPDICQIDVSRIQRKPFTYKTRGPLNYLKVGQ